MEVLFLYFWGPVPSMPSNRAAIHGSVYSVLIFTTPGVQKLLSLNHRIQQHSKMTSQHITSRHFCFFKPNNVVSVAESMGLCSALCLLHKGERYMLCYHRIVHHVHLKRQKVFVFWDYRHLYLDSVGGKNRKGFWQ